MADKSLGPLTFGFDIGIASVGWCVLGKNRIVDLGVRCFDKAETPDKGESLNKARRDARLMRRRLRRRAWRLTKLSRLLKREGLIANANLFKMQHPFPHSPWQLRVAGLDRALTNEEWAQVIYHLCKHRGFHWISRAEEKAADEDKKEGGPVKKGLAETASRMSKYRSAGEMVLAEFPDAQRNKQGDYGKALKRALLGEELDLLFENQRAAGNPFAGESFRAKVLDLFWAQNPPLAGAKLLEMVGCCTFEKTEYRAPKASFTAERHVWLTRLNNLKIVVDGVTRRLNEEERRIALRLPYEYDTPLTYKRLHDALAKAGQLPAAFAFAGLRAAKKEKDPLAEILIKLPAWQELRKTLKKAGLEIEWKGLAGAALDGRPEMLDAIAWVLSVYKADEETEAELRKLPLPNADKLVKALLDFPRTSFKAFHALSLNALRKIVPHMEIGLRYDEACQRAGYHHSQANKGDGEEKEKYLPPLYENRRGTGPGQEGKMIFSERIEREITGGIPRNPVVLRALNQARKVANALIRKHGSPVAVHVEMARDLSRPQNGHWTDNGKYIEGRRDIEAKQKEFRDQNEKAKAAFAAEHGIAAKSREFEKFQLYREQQGKCAYSLEPLDLHRVLHDIGYAEVDHALPYSRSYDDSKNNKVLVFAKENRDKGNRTPYEYLTSFEGGEDGERWREFVAFVEATYPAKTRNAKKSRLLRKNFGKEEASEFKERNLNDTRYICKFFKNYVERYLILEREVGAGETADADTNKRSVVLSGQLTAFLRARWGLIKVRSDSDRHHALDAAVVAACSHAMVKRLSDYSRRHELDNVRNGYVDAETGVIIDPEVLRRLERNFPEPWPHFRFELCARLNINDPAELREAIIELGAYPAEAIDSLRPLFVSRAPQRRNGGAIHEETIRSAKRLDDGVSYVKVPLHKLKLEKLRDIVGATYSRNAPLIAVLRERLDKHGNDGKKAFAEPVFKPSKKGKGSLVKSVKLTTTQNSGIRLRGGIAELGGMDHVDVFKNGNRYHVEPAYQAFSDSRINPPGNSEDTEFQFSLSKNDYIRLRLGDVSYEGYFVMYESDGRMTLRAHDQPKPDKEYFRKSVAGALSIEKFHVDVLGNIYPAPQEQRLGLA